MIFVAAIILLIIDLIYFIFKISFKKAKADNVEGFVIIEKDFYEAIEHDYKAVRIIVNLLLLASSIYIFIFVDSLHKHVKEFRNRYYVVAKL